MSTVPLAACLVVRDEEGHLADCLHSLRGLVDAVVVYDTGSTDASRKVAAEAGARVVAGSWHHDFARARNEALALVDADWVLSIDADERVRARPAPLRRQLRSAAAADAYRIAIHNLDGEDGGWTHTAVRLFRPGRGRWAGAVHEAVTGTTGPLRTAELPEHLLALDHLGYADPAVRAAKGARNAALARAMLADSGLAADPERRGRALLDLGRSELAAGRRQAALDALVAAREAASAPPRNEALWQVATDFLARLLLAAGEYEVAAGLAAQLAAAGVDRRYCAGWTLRCWFSSAGTRRRWNGSTGSTR